MTLKTSWRFYFPQHSVKGNGTKCSAYFKDGILSFFTATDDTKIFTEAPELVVPEETRPNKTKCLQLCQPHVVHIKQKLFGPLRQKQ